MHGYNILRVVIVMFLANVAYVPQNVNSRYKCC